MKAQPLNHTFHASDAAAQLVSDVLEGDPSGILIPDIFNFSGSPSFLSQKAPLYPKVFSSIIMKPLNKAVLNEKQLN